jgi:hypothetical protein
MINDLTFSTSFALVGLLLGEAMAETQHDEQSASTGTPGTQLSFQFAQS